MKNDSGNRDHHPSSGMENLKFLLRYIYPYRWVFLVGLISLAVSALTILVIPKILGQLINDIDLQGGEFLEVRNRLIWAAAILLVIQACFSFLRVYTFTYVMERGLANLRKDLFGKILGAKVEFFDRSRVGDLMSRLTADVSTVQDAFSIDLAEFLRQSITIIVGTALLINISWKLTLTMSISLPLFILLAFIFGRFIRRIARQKQDALAASNIIAEESFGNIRVVKAFNQEDNEIQRYGARILDVVRIAVRGAVYRGSFISFIIIGLFGVLFLLFFQGIGLAYRQSIQIGDLVEFMFYTGFIGGSIAGMGNLATKFQTIVGSTDRIVGLLKSEEQYRELKRSPVDLQGGITFSHVSFSYPTRAELPILSNITFAVQPGETVALVGHSGAGKSTIFQLLLRFYAPDEGHILFDDYDAADYHPDVMRDHISVVPQEVVLFGGTIRENIAYGKQQATQEEIVEAATKANAMEFIDTFPDGLDTVVGERGIKLSGGQRQRVAIARAILKDPAILLLDEATSSLDAESEKLIQSALEGLMEGRTTLIIAHRLSTIRTADRILVMNQGEIIESGNHEELILNEDGLYKHLLKLQYQIA
jgi:ABC-type multidrug transport system fused ATPase/permease subunit